MNRGGGGQCFLFNHVKGGGSRDGKQFPEKEDDFADKAISVHFKEGVFALPAIILN